MIHVTAVYENGVLRPTRPLELREGQTVEVTVTDPTPPPKTVEEWKERMRAAKSLREWADLAGACPEPDPDPDFDVVRAINETRKLTGFRVVDPAYRDEEQK